MKNTTLTAMKAIYDSDPARTRGDKIQLLRTLGLEETRGALEGLAARFAGHGLEPEPAGNGSGNGCGKELSFTAKGSTQEKMPATPAPVVVRRKRTA